MGMMILICCLNVIFSLIMKVLNVCIACYRVW